MKRSNSNDTFSSNIWLDKGTRTIFKYDDKGNLIDRNGNGPTKSFLNDSHFSNWLHLYIEDQLLNKYHLKRQIINENVPIYHSENAFSSPQKLLLLIPGAGKIGPGVLSVEQCAYKGLHAGSMLPMVEEGLKREMEIIILNPNGYGGLRTGMENIGRFSKIKSLSQIHAAAVVADFVIPTETGKVWIYAHSKGGEIVSGLLAEFPVWFTSHVAAFALTDGEESSSNIQPDVIEWAKEHGINWIKSDQPLDTPLKNGLLTKHRSSASKESLANLTAFASVWHFFDNNQ